MFSTCSFVLVSLFTKLSWSNHHLLNDQRCPRVSCFPINHFMLSQFYDSRIVHHEIGSNGKMSHKQQMMHFFFYLQSDINPFSIWRLTFTIFRSGHNFSLPTNVTWKIAKVLKYICHVFFLELSQKLSFSLLNWVHQNI